MTFLKDAPSTDIYYSFVEYINGVMSTRVHPEKLIEARNFHTHVVSNNPLQIYFIGGNEYNDYDGTIEIWEMIWDHEGCPQWCHFNSHCHDEFFSRFCDFVAKKTLLRRPLLLVAQQRTESYCNLMN